MTFRAGDIAACYGTDALSRTIRWGTASLLERPRLGPSHVAILALAPHAAETSRALCWYESTTLCQHSCLIGGAPKSGMQVHRPVERICDYTAAGGRVEVYRLARIQRMSREEEQHLLHLLVELYHADYDYGGAVLSGTRVFQLSRLFPKANLHSLFCSELIAAVLMRMNRMNHDNPGRMNPSRLLRTLLRTGIYNRHCWYAQGTQGRLRKVICDTGDCTAAAAVAGLVTP